MAVTICRLETAPQQIYSGGLGIYSSKGCEQLESDPWPRTASSTAGATQPTQTFVFVFLSCSGVNFIFHCVSGRVHTSLRY